MKHENGPIQPHKVAIKDSSIDELAEVIDIAEYRKSKSLQMRQPGWLSRIFQATKEIYFIKSER